MFQRHCIKKGRTTNALKSTEATQWISSSAEQKSEWRTESASKRVKSKHFWTKIFKTFCHAKYNRNISQIAALLSIVFLSNDKNGYYATSSTEQFCFVRLQIRRNSRPNFIVISGEMQVFHVNQNKNPKIRYKVRINGKKNRIREK